MLSEEEIENNKLYKAIYMQNPFEILTEENLERLEKHCKKAIHYEKGNIREEHEIVLTLLYKYKQLESELEESRKSNQKLIEKLEETMKRIRGEGRK